MKLPRSRKFPRTPGAALWFSQMRLVTDGVVSAPPAPAQPLPRVTAEAPTPPAAPEETAPSEGQQQLPPSDRD